MSNFVRVPFSHYIFHDAAILRHTWPQQLCAVQHPSDFFGFAESSLGYEPSTLLEQIREAMGSMTAECYWCGEIRSLYIPDWVGGGLCNQCIEHGMKNGWRPPIQPDARERLKQDLCRWGCPMEVATLISEFTHDVFEP